MTRNHDDKHHSRSSDRYHPYSPGRISKQRIRKQSKEIFSRVSSEFNALKEHCMEVQNCFMEKLKDAKAYMQQTKSIDIVKVTNHYLKLLESEYIKNMQ